MEASWDVLVCGEGGCKPFPMLSSAPPPPGPLGMLQTLLCSRSTFCALLSSSGSCALVSVTLMQRAVALPCPALALTAPLSCGLVHLQALSRVGKELIACYHGISFHQVPVGRHLICRLPEVLFASSWGLFPVCGALFKNVLPISVLQRFRRVLL